MAVDWRPLLRRLLDGRNISKSSRQKCGVALSKLARYVEGQGYEGLLDLGQFFENDDGSYDQIDEATLLRFFAWVRGRFAPSSYNATLIAIRYMMRIAVGKRILDENPMPRLREIRLPRRRQEALTVEEFGRLQQAALHGPQPARDLCMLGLCITVGPRPAELRQLRPEDVETKLSSVKFLREVKTFEAASALMSDLKELLSLYQRSPLYVRRTARELFVGVDGKAFTAESLGGWLKNLYECSNVHKNGGLYVFRRSMATMAHQAGIPTVLISRQLRHETLQSTGRYVNVEFPWEDQVKAVEKGVLNLHL